MKKWIALGFSIYSTFLQAQTSLPAAWNFSSPGITSPPIGWTLDNSRAGGTGGQTYAFGTGDNLSCRFDAAGENLIVFFADKPGPLSYYVSPQNAGNPWSGLFEVQESADGNSWSNLRTFTSQATTTTNFTNGKRSDNLSATTRYVRFVFTTKTSGNFALDSVLIQQAPPPLNASIQIKQNGNVIVGGSTFILGNASATTFTIENKGTGQTLHLDSVSFSGTTPNDYSVSNFPDSIIANGNATFTLNFSAAQNGSRKAAMNIYSNDADRPKYTINVYGIGGNYATEPAQPPVLNTSNVMTYGFDATLLAPVQVPEHYIVLLYKNGAGDDKPMDGVTYKRGDYIGAAQVLYVGDSASLIKPTHILSNTGYAMNAFSFNGPAGFENYYTTNSAFRGLITPGKKPGTYYSGINSGAPNFVSTLSQKINPHDTIYYSQYISRFIQPYLTRDTIGGKKIMNCVYTTLPYVYTEPFLFWNGTNGATLTREHTYPQSWMPTRSLPTWPNDANGKELPEYNDLHHLFPADQAYGNGVRSNYPLGEVVTNPQPSPSGLGVLGKDLNGNTVYEPTDAHKGDAARAIFYMCTAYNGISGNNWSIPSSQDQDVLKKWHFQDLPDNWEIARHEFIYSIQHNRNPFIDSINFACRIDFRNMTWIANPGSCGIDERRVTVLTPNGGQDLKSGTITLVMWDSYAIDSVKIELYHADTFFAYLGKEEAAREKFFWKVGYHTETLKSSDFKIRVTDLHSPAFDLSDDYFKIEFLLNALDEINNTYDLQVYPNPTSGTVYLQALNGLQIQSIRVLDLLGKTHYENSIHADNLAQIQLDKKGMYLVEVVTDRGVVRKRVVRE
ncbi:MAG: endonuclease [Bacteroidia bacterium]